MNKSLNIAWAIVVVCTFIFIYIVPVKAEPEPGDREKGPARAREVEVSGPLRIKKIRIKGCKKIPRRTIRSILLQEKTPWWKLKLKEGGFDPFWAMDDRRRIEMFYRGKGFYSAKVEEPLVEIVDSGRAVEITYIIEEGEPVRVQNIEIIFEDGTHRDDDLERLRSRLEYKEGDRFEIEPYQEARTAIEEYYQDEAYYRVSVTRKAEVDPDAGTALVKYRIKRGPKYRLESISIEGCEQTKPEVVSRAMELEPGDKYRRNESFDDYRRIQSLPIYRTVRMVEKVNDDPPKIDLTVQVEEGKPREARVGLGYGSEEGIRAQASWQHVNFMGGARELMISARWSELLEREQIKFVQPNFNRPGDFVQLLGERKVEHEEAYTHQSVAASPTYHFTITRYLWAEVSYRAEQNLTSRVLDILELTEEDLAREGFLSAVSGLLEWADIDDPMDPVKGARASVYVELGGGPMGGDFSYTKVIGEARGYYPIYGEVVGALKWKLGWSEPTGDLDAIPLFKRFYTGGTGRVRGFDRFELGPADPDGKPIGGARMWEGSFELRFPIWEDLQGVAFLDSGWVWPEGQDYDPDDVVYSTGAGIRYDTAVGPIALDVGFPLDDNPDYPEYRIHFNVGHSF